MAGTRTREMGIRVALGADFQSVCRTVLSHGVRLVVIGTVAGIAGSLLLSRLIADLLYGVKPSDPTAFAGATILFVAVALAASFIPAARAASMDPMESLRSE